MSGDKRVVAWGRVLTTGRDDGARPKAGSTQGAPARGSRAHFAPGLLEAIGTRAALRVRAGSAPHRFLGIWAVVVKDRVFVRSWNDAPSGWNRAWRSDPEGAIEVEGKSVAVRARPVRGVALLDAISAAYREKYRGPGSVRYAIGMADPARRKTTLELIPASGSLRAGSRARGGPASAPGRSRPNARRE